jgi:hypothetical protein
MTMATQKAAQRSTAKTKASSGFTAGFSDEANLDDGAMWPTYFALKELTAAVETKIRVRVKAAVS